MPFNTFYLRGRGKGHFFRTCFKSHSTSVTNKVLNSQRERKNPGESSCWKPSSTGFPSFMAVTFCICILQRKILSAGQNEKTLLLNSLVINISSMEGWKCDSPNIPASYVYFWNKYHDQAYRILEKNQTNKQKNFHKNA